MLRKTKLVIFVNDIQKKDGIFENVQNIIMNFAAKVNLEVNSTNYKFQRNRPYKSD